MSQNACRGFFDAWNERDFEKALTYVADDCYYTDYGFVRPHEGKAEVEVLFRQAAEALPDATFEILRITGEHDVGCHWEIYRNGQPTGVTGVSYYAFDEDDRLVWALDATDPGEEYRTKDRH